MHDRFIRLRFLFLITHLLLLLMILIFKKETIVKENGTIFLNIKYREVHAENLQDELNEISNRLDGK
ncbi:hypothetical protein TNIN_352561 [Trichonephila inaurata madagascariensis]|uniref:Uncharacterized protein n=1 Tax=Trichonephila inaurata madagascariensis TaxID=2747483 RepID=A0A8X6XCZ4_9ARAC|nr:hypothetical protein TNIN_352561 [Trichonephila inaurata madagascariensis]